MLIFDNGHLVQSPEDIPVLSGRLFIDLETTSSDPKFNSLSPWFHCSILGTCISDGSQAWYVPIRFGIEWLQDTMNRCTEWVNHNIKYDAHVMRNAGVIYDGIMIDTLTLAKLINSDRWRYGLAALSKDWLHQDISRFETRLKNYLKGSKDYGDVPEDIMAEYGCQDVLTNAKLYTYITKHIPEQSHKVRDTEIKLTSVLFDIERQGMRIDPMQVKITQFKAMREMLELEEWLHTTTDTAIRPHTASDCYEVLCGKYGLPVLETTDSGNPSFNKAAFVQYEAHPDVKGKLLEIVQKIKRYRHLSTLNNFFLEPYQKWDVLMHPFYNQSVRTGRMSCSDPNAQQLSIDAKKLILPEPDRLLMDADYSQIEFRIMVHYMKNQAAIEAYKNDPTTDFHQWVSNMTGIARGPAKNINFAMGFGGGKSMVLKMLERNMELMSKLPPEMFKQRADQVYSDYHKALPELKQTSYLVSKAVERRGYVHNLFGRHRHLPRRASYKGFNTIVQSSAADIIKEAVVATSPRFNEFIKSKGITQVAVVHDNILFNCDDDPSIELHVKKIMESPSIELRVPIMVVTKKSAKSWADIV